jgi:hypothetical protein
MASDLAESGRRWWCGRWQHLWLEVQQHHRSIPDGRCGYPCRFVSHHAVWQRLMLDSSAPGEEAVAAAAACIFKSALP